MCFFTDRNHSCFWREWLYHTVYRNKHFYPQIYFEILPPTLQHPAACVIIWNKSFPGSRETQLDGDAQKFWMSESLSFSSVLVECQQTVCKLEDVSPLQKYEQLWILALNKELHNNNSSSQRSLKTPTIKFLDSYCTCHSSLS